MTRLAILFLLCIALFSRCRKDFDINTEKVLGPIPTVNVQASLTGRVTAPDGAPLSGATVVVAGQVLTTDGEGLFFVHKKLMDQNGTYVRVMHTGFFDAHKFAFPNLNTAAFLEIRMTEKTLSATFDAANGATFTANGGGEVSIPASAIAYPGGQPYSGEVRAYAIWLDPSENSTFDRMPGDLRGRDAEGYAKILKTFGMIGVELETPAGGELNLLPGKKAAVSLALDGSILPGAPATIPTWHFDEAIGYWQEDGSATLTGNRYHFEVGHFSFWNCDIPENFIRLSGSIVALNGDPLISARVVVSSQNFGTNAAYTDNEGKFSGYVPKGAPLTIQVGDGCGMFQYTENIGPFESDAELGAIEITNPNAITITGTLQGCNLDPVVNGLAIIRLNGSPYAVVLSDDTGHFSAMISTCLTNVVVSLSAFDESTLMQSAQVSLPQTGNTVDMGNIPVCITLDEYITLNVDDLTKTFPHNLNFDYSNGAGRFSGTIGSDTVFVLADFVNYQDSQAILASLIINLKAPGSDNSIVSYHSMDIPTIYFNEFPTMPGEYAIGSVEGHVTKYPNSTPIPYSLSFRIKKQ